MLSRCGAFIVAFVAVVKEVAIAMESENFFLACFPTVWNFVVNYSASNYILLILCYEKFVMITLPFRKDKLLWSVHFTSLINLSLIIHKQLRWPKVQVAEKKTTKTEQSIETIIIKIICFQVAVGYNQRSNYV